MVERYSYKRETEISHYSHRSSSNNPSFSSTLLDAIYRSIDQGEEEVVIYREAMRKKQSFGSEAAGGGGANVRGVFKSEEEMANFQRACMIEKWMEKKVSEKVVVRRKSDLQTKKPRKEREHSSSSSSDSSSGGGGGGFFSSSEAESFPVQRPKPVRTGGLGFDKEKLGKNHRDLEFNRRDRRGLGDELEQKPKNEGGFSKTKSRALKIYGDLKKVKQPISPGSKLAGFLNSLFTGGNLKKPKIAGNGDIDSPSLKSTNASTCSSASSFSRSCLSKTPSSRGKSSAGTKRSVRFSPVSVIVDEDCQPCGQKSVHESNNNRKQASNYEVAKNKHMNSIRTVIKEELMVHVMEKNRRVEEVARDLLRNYQRKNHKVGYEHEPAFDVKNLDMDEEEEKEEIEDTASYASSDLFELDNLSAIGMERYGEELPVYETTHLHTNRAIANGLILY
ncbi:protein BIG GRAIN 1-like B isoform X2 [Sesamum indicum]|uniref:Protein BIG GRAIN 1-like B isoform X1 n=1 Tax=Sesamum indicum TaxID=4182 RepID=A0A6I9SRP8_SESIN|nr:protein BIG GRAIN 1-like B isoform X1 [Sesamum indicum]XP_011072571.1 protein BIG GRAIN 1-like B isoform X2 [Sesamum indicum]